GIVMALEAGPLLAGDRVPQLDGLVPAAGGERPAVWGTRHRHDPAVMSDEGGQPLRPLVAGLLPGDGSQDRHTGCQDQQSLSHTDLRVIGEAEPPRTVEST